MRLLLSVVLVLWGASISACADSDLRLSVSFDPETTSDSQPLSFCVGQLATLRMASPIGAVVVGSDEIVSTNILSPNLIVLTAREAGNTELVILSEDRASDVLINIEVVSRVESEILTQDIPAEEPEPISPVEPEVVITVHRGTESITAFCVENCLPE